MTQFKLIKNMTCGVQKESTLQAFKFNGREFEMRNKSFLDESCPLPCGSKLFFHTPSS